MVGEQNIRMPGVQFNRGMDVTAEMLNGLQQYLSNELSERTRDLVKYPGFAWGLRVGAISGQSITITKGVGFDQYGSRIYHDTDAAYKLTFPFSTTSTNNVGYLCVQAQLAPALYKVHPYDGTRHSVESVTSLVFSIQLEDDLYKDFTRIYAPGNNGLVIARLTISGSSYNSSDASADDRSPMLTLRNGSLT